MDLSQLLQDYQSKISTKDLQIKYNLSWYTLTKILKENNVYKKNNSLTTSDDKMDFIKNNYFTKSNKELSEKLNINEDWIRVLAEKLGLPKKGSGWKYNQVIENLDWSSKEFSYFLGWMASDGNISKNYSLIKLSITDKDIIDNFKNLFPNASIYYTPKENQKDMHTLCICSKDFGIKLNNLGITPNKGKTLSIQLNLWDNHFVRGFFEGDGHVRNSLDHRGKKRYEAGFVTASEIFSNQLISYLGSQNIVVKVSKEKSYFRLRIGGKDNLENFYKFLYKDCDKWYLKRKKQILDQLFSNE